MRSTIWVYFAAFTATILFVVWFFQAFTLNRYYEMSTRSKIYKIAAAISQQFNDDYPVSSLDVIEDLAYNNTATIVVTDRNGNPIITADFMGGFSALTSRDMRIYEYSSEVL